jgi:GNAT superfamily N-acetyltransferase
MFWKGKVSFISQLDAFIRQKDVSFATIAKPELSPIHPVTSTGCKISAASLIDVSGIAMLLNQHFEPGNNRVQTAVTPAWIRATYLGNYAIWIIAKDRGGTIRGCVSSFRVKDPYPNSLAGCGVMNPWGIVDWFCVHPLWRSKGVGTSLLEALDIITYKIGRKAHVFLKEGLPLPLPHLPVYVTYLMCRKAGNPSVTKMREDCGLVIHPYHTIDKDSKLNLIKVEGLRGAPLGKHHIDEWEDALDRELPPCIVFVTADDQIDMSRGWKTDSFISMYAFRWLPGKWLFSLPNQQII